MTTVLTAEKFIERLTCLQSDEELNKHQRYFKFVPDDQDADDYFIGVRMGSIFELSKAHSEMPVNEIEKLMESPVHEVRADALSIMGQCAKGNKCSEERLTELYECTFAGMTE